MIIAIDFDQTFTSEPNMWAGIIELMNDYGHRVICVTCRPEWDTAGMDQIEKIIGSDNIFFTDNMPKIEFMEERCHVDIWIDDTPATVTGGGKVMYKPNKEVSDG